MSTDKHRRTRHERYPYAATGASLIVAATGTALAEVAPTAGSVTATLGVVGAGYLTYTHIRNRNSSAAVVGRWNTQSRRHEGVASARDHRRITSARAMRRNCRQLAPELMTGLGWWERRRVPVVRYASRIAKDGRHQVYSPIEDVVTIIGAPRTGKSGLLASLIIDAPGAVVATSTRTDLVYLTEPMRRQVGPIYMFNPSGINRVRSSVRWSPLAGCKNPMVANGRASDMLPESDSPEAERWDMHARAVLGVFMHAAALVDRPMSTVLRWVSNPRADTTVAEVQRALRKSPEADAFESAARQFFGMNDRTQTSITTTMMPALRWLTDPRAAEMADIVGSDADLFDVRRFVRERGTLYLLGKQDGTTTALVAAFTAEIARAANALAQDECVGGRLDPGLTIALDEAAIICPVPLDQWTADMGGRNIKIITCVQSRAQLKQVWGDDGAAIIMNNSACVLIYGGARDPADLAAYSVLSSDREDRTPNTDGDGNVTGYTTTAGPVLTPARIANLPKGYAMMIYRGIRPCIVRTRMAWERRDVRRAMRRTPYAPDVELRWAIDPAVDIPPDVDGDGKPDDTVGAGPAKPRAV